MKTSKDTIEYQITKQMEEREIAPSRDLWSEIELQNSSNYRYQSKINWFLAAACLMLALSVGAVLFFLNQPSEIEPVIVKAAEKAAIKETVADSTHNVIPLLTAHNNEKQQEKPTGLPNQEETTPAVAIEQTSLIRKEIIPVRKLE